MLIIRNFESHQLSILDIFDTVAMKISVSLAVEYYTKLFTDKVRKKALNLKLLGKLERTLFLKSIACGVIYEFFSCSTNIPRSSSADYKP